MTALPNVRAVLAQAYQPSAPSQIITLNNVGKSYQADDGQQLALRSISFSVQAGEFVFITGPSGAGKSTLLRLLHGQLAPDEGTITLGGIDIRSLDLRQFRRQVGYVAQSFEVLPLNTVAENLAAPLEMWHQEPRLIKRRVDELLDIFDLGHARNRLAADNLSGGEQQRLAIARAIAHRPDLLLCDEPTGNLDIRNGYQVMRMLNRVSMQGTTVICATHDENLVDLMQKRVVVIKDGTIASDSIGGYRLD